MTEFSFSGWLDRLNRAARRSDLDCRIARLPDDDDITAFLLAICRTTGPLRILLKIEIASPWLRPCKIDPLTARISSPIKEKGCVISKMNQKKVLYWKRIVSLSKRYLSLPSNNLPFSAACPVGRMVFTNIPIIPFGESRPPTILNPKLFLPCPFSKTTV